MRRLAITLAAVAAVFAQASPAAAALALANATGPPIYYHDGGRVVLADPGIYYHD